MTSYKIYVNDRSYTSWEVFDTNNFNKITLDINPLESKLLSNDVFTVNKDNTINLIHSSVRSGPAMPAVLILAGNKTYGRQNKMKEGQTYTKKHSDMAGGKLLYKCIPDDMRLPSFLVPYEIKNMGFSKVFKNLYVTINYDNWDDKHPRAKLDNVIGPVDVLDNFYEYQLYCKSLNASIQKFQKDTSKALESKCHDGIIDIVKQKYPDIQDRTDQKFWHIITIDPPKSVDFDDGFSIVQLEDGIQQLSIYISNVTIYINNVRNSHEVVCYLMILMNYHSAKELIKYKTGIFRSTIIKREFSVPDTIPDDVSKFIKIWNSASGQYINGAEIIDTRHEILDMDAYIHITSPIRRLVDLLNMIQFQQVTGIIKLSENVSKFYNKWLEDIDYINTTMRSIRKVQCDCSLLDLCHNNPEVMEKEYDGYLFDKINRNDGLYQFVVFLPELKLSSRITMRDNFDNFECKKFKLFLFNNEENFKRKIRLQII